MERDDISGTLVLKSTNQNCVGNLTALVKEMMQSDLHLMKKDQYLRNGGYTILNYYE